MARAQHPFYVKEWSDDGNRPKPVGHEDLGKNWVGAGHLKIGDKIKQADGTTGVVANVVTVQQTRQMFNLTVSEAHTYYVGQDGWLVHNANRCEKMSKALANGIDPVSTPATAKYQRPSYSVSNAQREAVQGQPCATCGTSAPKMIPDHIDPLMAEYYRTGTINKTKMLDVGSVQPQCPACSNKQEGELSTISRFINKLKGW